jgi:hypothetical protein
MKYLLLGLLAISLLSCACSRKEVKSETETKLTVEPAGYYYLNMMPTVPTEGPSFHAVFKIKVINVGKTVVKNLRALHAELYKVSDNEETKLAKIDLKASPDTPEENDLIPGEDLQIEYGGTLPGATQITPGTKLYGKVFVVWDGGDTSTVTPTEEVIVTR